MRFENGIEIEILSIGPINIGEEPD